MGKIAEYLRTHLDGEVTDAVDVREHFSTDGGLVKITPQTVIYPFSESDVRKVARFAWQLAEKGKKIAITSRGLGSDWSGGAVGDGITVAFPAHMNKIIELDSREAEMVVEPGATIGKVNQALVTHGLYLPIDPLSAEFSTIGGAVATNASSFRSAKYGLPAENVTKLRVVLTNGEVIETERVSKRELRKKMGLTTFEGEIYRGIDAILTDHAETIAGYSGKPHFAPLNVFDIRHKDGSIDLTPLFIGSQGSLGIVTQIRTKVTAYNPGFRQAVYGFYNVEEFNSVAPQIVKLAPSMFTVIPRSTLELFASLNPSYINAHFPEKLPELLVLLEWDEFSLRVQKKATKKLAKLCQKMEVTSHLASTEKAKEKLAKFYRLPAVLLQSELEHARAVPGIESAYVAAEHLPQLVTDLDEMLDKVSTRGIVWYDYVTGIVRCFPFLDLRQLGQRQKLLRAIDLFNELVVVKGGAVGVHGGGRIAASSHKQAHGDVLYAVFEAIKQLFDPYEVLSPGVKFKADKNVVAAKMNQGYTLSHRHNHLPR